MKQLPCLQGRPHSRRRAVSWQYHRHRRVEGAGRQYGRSAHHRLRPESGDADRLDLHRRRRGAHPDRRLRHGVGRRPQSAGAGLADLGPVPVHRLRHHLGCDSHSDTDCPCPRGGAVSPTAVRSRKVIGVMEGAGRSGGRSPRCCLSPISISWWSSRPEARAGGQVPCRFGGASSLAGRRRALSWSASFREVGR